MSSSLKILLIGYGFMGRMHVNVYKMLPNAEVVGCVDPNPENGKKFTESTGQPVFSSLEEAHAAIPFDVVDVCLPTDMHRGATEAGAKLGKHVFSEKPMSISMADARSMAATCEANGVRLFIGHCIRFWPEYAYLKKLTDEKRLGELKSINLTRYGSFPKWAVKAWTSDPDRAGGGVLDMHIHDTDFAHYLLGKPDQIVSFGTVDQTGPSHVFTTMTFGKKIAHLEGGWNLPQGTPFKHSFRAIYENGAAIMDAGPLTIYEEGKDPFQPEFAKMTGEGGGNISDLGGYYHEIKYFVDCILNDQPFVTVTPQTSLDSLETVLEEIRQIRERQ